jgi:deoxyribonuclease IV
MRVGAHVPTRGRLARAVDYAEAIGADAFQLFVSNPRAWSPPSLRHAAVDEFHERLGRSPVEAVFVHSTYLINVASPDPAFHRRSIELALAELGAAAAIGADGLVIHAGAGGAGERAEAVARTAEAVRAVASLGGPPVLLELTAGGAGAVASTIPQAAELLAAVDEPRVGLCLDTCHLVAAGYPLDDPAEAAGPFDELRELGLAERLGLVHGNDARDPRGSRLDRHEHPGRGTIGEAGFRAVLADPLLREATVLVETRGHEEEHAADVAALRGLAAAV